MDWMLFSHNEDKPTAEGEKSNQARKRSVKEMKQERRIRSRRTLGHSEN